jgi:pimeloyl-ACP methyl ester carboxylesterase
MPSSLRSVRNSALRCAWLMLAVCSLALLSVQVAAGIPPERWQWTEVNGHRLYYAVHGAGRTLVLLHGGGDSAEHSFEQQIDMLSLQHRIIAFDQVGHGHTPEVPGPLTYSGMMQDTAQVLQRLKLRNVDVMGFSDGGILALMLAARHPELVRRLVISGVNIAPEGLTDEQREGLRAAQSPKPDNMDSKLTQLWLNSPTMDELNPALLATIHKPVLVISGDRDAIRLEHTLEIYRALPDAELCILPGTAHGTFSGRPEWLNPIINAFLDRP